MSILKKSLHDLVIWITRLLFGFLPDHVPLTFLGENATSELCVSMFQTGRRRALIVTDEGLVAAGLVARVEEALTAAGMESEVYAGVQPDPTFDQVEEGLRQLKDRQCDTILALGGGSSMDAAKIIAAAATNGGDARKLEGMFKVKNPPTPFCAIPTTAGTGSEGTVAAVISEPKTHVKKFFVDPKILPEMAALDPSLMLGLPQPITAATGMDALTHAVESLVARTSRPQTERWALSAIQLIFTNLPRAYADGSDVEARRAMALASFYAGLAFTRTSVGYVHAFAHTFGAYYRTPHGLANAIALPHVLEFSQEQARAPLARMAEAIGISEGDEAARASAFIEAVRALKKEVGIPETLEALRREDIAPIAKQALGEAFMNYPVPRYMEQAEAEGLLGAMTE